MEYQENTAANSTAGAGTNLMKHTVVLCEPYYLGTLLHAVTTGSSSQWSSQPPQLISIGDHYQCTNEGTCMQPTSQ